MCIIPDLRRLIRRLGVVILCLSIAGFAGCRLPTSRPLAPPAIGGFAQKRPDFVRIASLRDERAKSDEQSATRDPELSSHLHDRAAMPDHRALFPEEVEGLVPTVTGLALAVEFAEPADDADAPMFFTSDASPAPGGPYSSSPLDDAWLAPTCPPQISFREDAAELIPVLWADFKSLLTCRNAIIIGAAAGVAVALREHADGDVRAYTAEYPLRWGEGSEVMRQFGEFAWQVPVLMGAYGLSLWMQDDHFHEFSKAAISAYTLTSLTTVTIKGITNTNRPTNEFQDGEYGFPSFHSGSTFSLAAVIDEYYGWPAGIPAYVLAGIVGWSRIDQREHDLSDVVFGSILGFVIGKSVAAVHLERYSNAQVIPYFDPLSHSAGVLLHVPF